MRRSPLARRTPLRPVRATPRRRSAGTTKRKPGKSAAEKRHHEAVAKMPCTICRMWPVEVHHVIFDGSGRITRDHKLVIPLCPICHREGENAVHRIGSRGFNFLFGIDQHALARALWEKSNG